ncbi:hypothetical protein [Bacillus massiliglaciei]|uniref:hypothetical protein n=1 Tax=Bacillus massiliglaciei TaxID=1816693 RepID=UPI000DA5F7C2|nr:hypothetical protein [Bacillus massiliglaciei]
MARCTNCHHKWKVKDIWSLGFSKYGKACPACGTKQYMSSDTLAVMSLGSISLLFLILVPFIMKISDKDESLVKQ